ncbi:MAG: 8-oxo-dGTP diphosphatase [Chloroflexota bacterium]
MKDATLCLLVKDSPGDQMILLGKKKRGFGLGKYVGMGGKIEAGETLEGATVREIKEEINVLVKEEHLIYAAHLLFVFPFKPSWDHDVHVYLTKHWQGDPQESDEILPVWYPLDDLPYASMWDDARYWLPHILAGDVIEAHFTFQSNNQIVAEARIDKISNY